MTTPNENAIKWNDFANEKNLISDNLAEEFGRYFKGEYIRPQYLTADLLHLNDFLKNLSKQELDILLMLKGSQGKIYITDKTFIEVLIHCLEQTGVIAKRPLLCAIDYIISKNETSRDAVISNAELFEKYANLDNTNINSIARSILEKINENYRPPKKEQYVFKKDEVYKFYQQVRNIIDRAKTTLKVWDNYANYEILDLVDGKKEKKNLAEVRIIFAEENNKTGLRLAKQKFVKEYPQIKLEIKQSKVAHDRYIIIDNEIWHLGPSIKDGGGKVCSIVQLKDAEATKLEKLFNEEWDKAKSL